MKKCKECGEKIDEEAKDIGICSGCGADLGGGPADDEEDEDLEVADNDEDDVDSDDE